METWTIFLTLHQQGLNRLLKILDEIRQKGFCSGHVAFVFPPDWILEEVSENTILNGLFCWAQLESIFKDDFIPYLSHLFSSVELKSHQFTEEFLEFISDVLHQLADELPTSGSCITQLYLFDDKEGSVENSPFHLLATLKRLEIWNQFYFGILSKEDVKSVWKEFLNIHRISDRDVVYQMSGSFIWYGGINLIFEKINYLALKTFTFRQTFLRGKRSGNLSLQQYCLFKPDDISIGKLQEELPIFKSTNRSNRSTLTFDNQLQIVSLIQSEEIPFHLISPYKFRLYKCQDGSETFFRSSLGDKNGWFVAFLKYDYLTPDLSNSTRGDWLDYLTTGLTRYLSFPSSRRELKHHMVLFIQQSSTEKNLDVFLMREHEQINSQAILKLINYIPGSFINEDSDDERDDKLRIHYNSTALIPPREWRERNAFYLSESTKRIGKSISRFKSDDFCLHGVEMPAYPLAKTEATAEYVFSDFLGLFDEHGRASEENFQPVPMIPDRLLKNMKAEEVVKSLSYEDAENVIGHGIEYCVDSLCATRLDNRLVKVQKRYIPDETISLSSYRPKPPAAENDAPQKRFSDTADSSTSKQSKDISIKMNMEKKRRRKDTKIKVVQSEDTKLNRTVIDNHQKQSSNYFSIEVDPRQKPESRSERHMRRLRTLIEGVILKYGNMKADDNNFKEACHRLFDICVPIVKCLRSSQGLNERMKQTAKAHLGTVMASFED